MFQTTNQVVSHMKKPGANQRTFFGGTQGIANVNDPGIELDDLAYSQGHVTHHLILTKNGGS